MKDRLRAFLIHLAISATIAVIAIIFVFFVWYPSPLHEAVGVTEVFLIVLAVDITIGPVITFIIFKRGKPSLPFDLAVIAILQIAALSYGMLTVFEGRPAFVVFNSDRFDVTRASDINPESLETAKQQDNEFGKLGWLSPRWVGSLKSKDLARRKEILFSSVQGGPDWPELPELFVPLSKVKQQILNRAHPIQKLYDIYKYKEEQLVMMDEWKTKKNVKWLALRGPVKDMIVLVNAKTAEIIKVVNISPWP